jgi:O-antigen ligase
MEKIINPNLDKTLSLMVYGSLIVLAMALLTSTTLLSLSHILMAFPALYFLNKGDYKNYPRSAWALLALTIIIIVSVFVNWDIAIKGYKPAFKGKYFLFGFVSLAPLYWFFQNKITRKKTKILLYIFGVATSLATLSGLCGTLFGYNPLLLKKVVVGHRYGGVFGMVLNYAHNMSFFLIIYIGLALYREKTKQVISMRFLSIVIVINLVGLYFSFTRGAWLGCLLALPFFYFKTSKKSFFAVGVGIVLTGIVAFFVAGDAMKRGDNDTTRLDQWKAAIYAFEERPIMGYGYLNFESHSVDIKKRNGLASITFGGHAHNNFFEMLGSTGFLGFLAFVLWLYFWFMEMFNRDDIIAKITLPLIIAIIVGGLTQSTISLGINLFFIMAIYSVSQMRLSQKIKEA